MSGAMRVEAADRKSAVVVETTDDGHTRSPDGGPAGQELKKNPMIQRALADAYAHTNAGNAKLAHEEGGWVLENTKTHELMVYRAHPGPAGTGDKGYFEINTNHPPHISGWAVVATFHVHCVTMNQLSINGGKFGVGPSGPDRDVAASQRVPGLVYDPTGSYAYGPYQRTHLDNGLGFPGWGNK
jgi:hypothetical protein